MEKLPEIVQWTAGIRIIHIKAGPLEPIPKETLLSHMDEFTENMLAFIRHENLSYALVHANFFMSAMVADDLKRILGIPYVVTFHALGYIRRIHQKENDKFPVERLAIERKIMEHADRIIAECPQDKEDMINYYAASPDKIVIIPCGYNPHEFYPVDKFLARMILKLDAQEFILLQLGRMVPRKGIDNVIKALAPLQKQGIKARLVVVGGALETPNPREEPELARLQQIASDHGVSERVTFVGRKNRDTLKFYYSASDIFITTPWYEPFGITPLESMACGVPVIGSEVGGIKYSVLDSKTGYLVPPNNPDALASKIQLLLEDEKSMAQMKEQALKRVETLFTWKKIAHSVYKLYEEVKYPYLSQAEVKEHKISMIENAFEKTITAYNVAKQKLSIPIYNAAHLIYNNISNQRRVLIYGNGKNAAQSISFARDVTRIADKFGKGNVVFSLNNDYLNSDKTESPEFLNQLVDFGQDGDLLIWVSKMLNTSGIVRTLKAANKKGIACITIMDAASKKVEALTRVHMAIPCTTGNHLQELNYHILQTLCEQIEHKFDTNQNMNWNGPPDNVEINTEVTQL